LRNWRPTMAEQKAGLDRELWARIGEIADAYSKKEMAADIAAAIAWAADRAHIEALEKENLGLLDAAVKAAERGEEER